LLNRVIIRPPSAVLSARPSKTTYARSGAFPAGQDRFRRPGPAPYRPARRLPARAGSPPPAPPRSGAPAATPQPHTDQEEVSEQHDHPDDQDIEEALHDGANDPQRDRHNNQQQKYRHLALSDLLGIIGARDGVRRRR